MKRRDYWNFRVLTDELGRYWIGEVHYKNDAPMLHTGPDYSPIGGETLDELKADVQHVLEALDKPVLRIEGSKIVGQVGE